MKMAYTYTGNNSLRNQKNMFQFSKRKPFNLDLSAFIYIKFRLNWENFSVEFTDDQYLFTTNKYFRQNLTQFLVFFFDSLLNRFCEKKKVTSF